MLLPMSTPTTTWMEEGLKAMTAENLAPTFARAERVQEFWNANFVRLRELYPEQWIAVIVETGEVAAVKADFLSLWSYLEDRGLDSRDKVAVERLTDWYRWLL